MNQHRLDQLSRDPSPQDPSQRERGALSCRDLIEFLMDYLDGELPADQGAAFQQHLDGCSICRQYVQTYQQSVALGVSIGANLQDDPPADVPEDLVRAILAAKQRGEF